MARLTPAAEVMERMFGEDEATKMALTANLEYYGDDPESLWFLWYAVAQGSFLASGGYYI
jgi:all-trans-retinol 13,14-reductase